MHVIFKVVIGFHKNRPFLFFAQSPVKPAVEPKRLAVMILFGKEFYPGKTANERNEMPIAKWILGRRRHFERKIVRVQSVGMHDADSRADIAVVEYFLPTHRREADVEFAGIGFVEVRVDDADVKGGRTRGARQQERPQSAGQNRCVGSGSRKNEFFHSRFSFFEPPNFRKPQPNPPRRKKTAPAEFRL